MKERNCLILTQYRKDSDYNDFIGKYYHFPATDKKNYLNQFNSLPIEVVYYEPDKKGDGVFYGYGKISKPPFIDKKTPDHYFVEISDFKLFSKPVSFKDEKGEILEKTNNTEFYNYNNAVRKVRPQFLDELCLDGGIILNFRADAHLVQVLGEQLIASERVGILELIKNAFDAGASNCKVRIENIPGIQEVEQIEESQFKHFTGPVIIIEDNGKGMSRDVIENGWLRPASRLKTNVKDEIRRQREDALSQGNIGAFNSWLKTYKAANKGRLPLGEKGVGRFATHRLGRQLILKTKIKENPYELVLKINWDDFEAISNEFVNLESVGITLTKDLPSRDYGEENSGTQLIIFGGREGFDISKKDVQDIYDSIQGLNSPFKNPFTRKDVERNITEFNVIFECPQLQSEFKTENIYDIAPPVFVFDAIVSDEGKMDYELKFNPPSSPDIPYPSQTIKNTFDLRMCSKEEFKINDDDYRKPASGAFFIHVDAWYRTSPWIATHNVKRASDWLDNYGGVALYRDFVSLFPAEWGANYDWLNLSKRHISKGSNMSYHNMNGYVEVFQDSNIDIIDKTDRQGLLENKAFEDLSLLVNSIVVNFIEKEFKGRRNDFTELKQSIIREPKENIERVSQDSSKLIGNFLNKNKYDVVLDPNKLLDFYAAEEREHKLVNLQNSLQNLEKSVRQILLIEERLVENAGFGLSAAVAIHELAKITGNFYNGITRLMKEDKLDKSKLNDLKDAASSLKSELKNLSPLRSIKNEPVRAFEISRAIEFAAEFYKRTFDKYHIEFSYNKEEDFTIIERFGTLCQIFTNLIDNSCYWLDTDTGNKKRKIELHLDKKHRTIIVADNGPGIDNSILPYLYQPGASMKSPPSGLGLYICQYYMNRMRGQIGLTNQRDRIESLKGAQFTLDFSRVDEA
ncbi:MAG: sensor histidine kinase [Saprospiraceae bacterium]|nr:sensor histidine kinase [Saprospiraceae bacterium]